MEAQKAAEAKAKAAAAHAEATPVARPIDENRREGVEPVESTTSEVTTPKSDAQASGTQDSDHASAEQYREAALQTPGASAVMQTPAPGGSGRALKLKSLNVPSISSLMPNRLKKGTSSGAVEDHSDEAELPVTKEMHI